LDLKTEEVISEDRKLHSEEINNLYFPKNIICIIRSMTMRRTRHVACRGDEKGMQDFDPKF
jgi:hypothetical protein